MQLTRSDAAAVHTTEKYVRWMERSVITDDELVNALFDNFYGCETDVGIEQCVAVVPQRLWPQKENKVADTLKQAHPGELFVYHPITPTRRELDELDHRVRHTMSLVINYLGDPTGVIEYEIDDPDGLRQQWFLFKHFETVEGEPCRKPDCGEDRIHNGVHCRAHHDEMIFGQPPPNATEQRDERAS
jgi:hypothetical protein